MATHESHREVRAAMAQEIVASKEFDWVVDCHPHRLYQRVLDEGVEAIAEDMAKDALADHDHELDVEKLKDAIEYHLNVYLRGGTP